MSQSNDLNEVGQFPSKSSAGKFYIVKRHRDTGALSCDCPAWRFKKGDRERTCKHVQTVAAGATPLPTPPVVEMEPQATDDVVAGLMADIEQAREKKPWQGLGQALQKYNAQTL